MNCVIQSIVVNQPFYTSEAFWNFIGWITTILLSGLGWFVAYRQINAGHRKTREIEMYKVKKELQIKAIDEMVEYMFEIRQTLIPPWLYLIGLPDDLRVVVSTEYNRIPNNSWENPDGNLSNVWNPIIEKFLRLEFYFSTKKVIFPEVLDEFNDFLGKYRTASNEIYVLMDFLREFYYLTYVPKKVTETEINIISDKCNYVYGLIDDVQKGIDIFNKRLQETYVKDIFDA